MFFVNAKKVARGQKHAGARARVALEINDERKHDHVKQGGGLESQQIGLRHELVLFTADRKPRKYDTNNQKRARAINAKSDGGSNLRPQVDCCRVQMRNVAIVIAERAHVE